MPNLHAVVLGICPRPVGVPAHLLERASLVDALGSGWDELSGDEATAFDVAVHVGTLFGAAGYLRRDVATYSAAALAPLARRGPLSREGRIGWALALSALPAGVVGVAAGGALLRSDRIAAIAVALIVFGLLLGLSDRLAERRATSDFGFGHALLMGVGQALALQPGVSRSGATMTVARLLGYERDAAVRLAFLMSLPVIAGAGLYGLVGLDVPSPLWPALAWGAASSLLTGWAAVWVTTRLVARLGLAPFVVYRVAVGCAVLVSLAVG